MMASEGVGCRPFWKSSRVRSDCRCRRGSSGASLFATRWDGSARTVHLYEISSSEAFPDGTFEAIRDFAERLHDGCGCFTAMWVADGDGHDPMKVWDVRDELIWVR